MEAPVVLTAERIGYDVSCMETSGQKGWDTVTGNRKGKSKRFCVTFDLGFVDGKRKRKYFYGANKTQARNKRDAFMEKYQLGTLPTSGKQTVRQFLEDWLETFVKKNKREKTYTSYEETTRLYVVPYVGSLQLNKLEVGHIDMMIAALQDKGLSSRTVQYACGVLSRALNRAVKRRKISENVVKLADVPKVVRQEIRPLSEEQAQQFLAVVKGHRLEPLYRVALSLGMRKGEIIALRWSDVDMSEGVVRIAKSKTEAGIRKIAIPPRLREVLVAHQERQQEERHIRDAEWQEHGLVFPSEVGTPILKGNLQRHFKNVLKRAGLPPSVRFHDLRHSCTSFLLTQGVDPRTVMGILGHSSMRTTMEIYGHMLDKAQQDALQKLDTMFT